MLFICWPSTDVWGLHCSGFKVINPESVTGCHSPVHHCNQTSNGCHALVPVPVAMTGRSSASQHTEAFCTRHKIKNKKKEFSVAWQQKHMLEAMSKLKRQKHFCSRRFVVGLISCLRILDSLFLFWVVAGEVVICLPELIKSPFVFLKATWQHMYCRHSCVWGRAYRKSGGCQSFLPISSHLTLTAFWGRGGVEGHSGDPFP